MKAYEKFKPSSGLQIGGLVFDEWLSVYLPWRAATMPEDGLEEALNKIRMAEIRAHNAMRPKDFQWHRDIDSQKEFVSRIVRDLAACENSRL